MMQREQEPFFKPLNVSSRNTEIAAKSQKARQKQFNAEISKQQENVGEDKLNFLHVKLHQEADKIRKWKNQTEFDLKQKDSKIQEASQTIESLRKSILDLQLRNETLSLSLNDEISNQKEIVESVAATRKLCSVLKDHMARTDSKLVDCEAEKTELRYLEKEHKKQFETLSNKYMELEGAKQSQKKEFETQIFGLKEENIKVTQELQQRLKATEQEILSQKVDRYHQRALTLLQNKCDEKDIQIRDISTEVQKNQEKIHTYEKTVDLLKESLKSKEEELSQTKQQHKQSCDMYEAVQVAKASVEEKLKESECQVESLVSQFSVLQTDHQASKDSHASEMLDARQKIDETNQHLSEKEERIQSLETDLDKTVLMLEEVKSSKDMLIMEKATLESRLNELEQLNRELQGQQQQNHAAMSEMSQTISELQSQLSASKEEGEALTLQLNQFRDQMSSLANEKLLLGEKMDTLEKDMTANQCSLGDLQKQLRDKSVQIENLETELQSLQKCLQLEQESHEKTSGKLNDTEEKLVQAKEEVKTKSKELKNLQKELDTLSKQNKSLSKTIEQGEAEEKRLGEEIEELKAVLELQKETNESLLEERQKFDEDIQGKLQTKSKETTDLETKNKSLKSDITVKNKQIKELEKELKSLKSKVTSITKTLDGREGDLEKLRSELETETAEREKLLEQISETEELMQKAQTQSEEAEKKAAELQALCDRCVAEKQEKVEQCEQMRTEMSSIMQNYKSDNDKLVTKKDQEIDRLKSQLQQAKQEVEQEVEAEMESLKKENENLRKTVSQSGYEMENLQRTYGQKENEVLELSKENMKKDEELRDLQQQLGRMALKTSTSSTVVQTSPFPDKKYTYSSRPATPREPPRETPRTPKTGLFKDKAYSYATTPKDPPRTPKTNPVRPSSATTPVCKQTPRQPPRTPTADLKTPQRSILKTLSTNSAFKKRRVVFATKDDDEKSVSSDSSTFEIIDHNEDKGAAGCSTPLLFKASPRQRSVEKPRSDPAARQETQPAVPLTRTPRGPPVSHDKKKEMPKEVKEKSSSVRKAPKKEAGKFFKSSPKTKLAKLREKDDNMSWFEKDDIFGFVAED